MVEYLINLHQVRARTSLGRSTIYAMVESGEFPRPVKIGAKAIRWKTSEIDQWIDSLDRAASVDREC